MSMAEESMENEEFNGTTIELEEDNQESSAVEAADSDSNSDETRTKVRKSSDGDDELESYSEGVKKRINQLTARRKAATEEAEAAVQYA